MFYSIFDSEPDGGRPVELSLDDTEIRSLLGSVATENMAAVTPSVVVKGDRIEQAGCISVCWSSECGFFEVLSAGAQAGVITLDELHGALGKSIPADGLACHVGLYVENQHVWRRGVIDPATGEVTVFTKRKEFDYAPAIALLADKHSGREHLIVELLPGAVSVKPIRMHGVQREWLFKQLREEESEALQEEPNPFNEPFSSYLQFDTRARELFDGLY